MYLHYSTMLYNTVATTTTTTDYDQDEVSNIRMWTTANKPLVGTRARGEWLWFNTARCIYKTYSPATTIWYRHWCVETCVEQLEVSTCKKIRHDRNSISDGSLCLKAIVCVRNICLGSWNICLQTFVCHALLTKIVFGSDSKNYKKNICPYVRSMLISLSSINYYVIINMLGDKSTLIWLNQNIIVFST